jgi:hypothetical protein
MPCSYLISTTLSSCDCVRLLDHAPSEPQAASQRMHVLAQVASGHAPAGHGGALRTSAQLKSITLVNCLFVDNLAADGGAMHLNCPAVIVRSIFARNEAARGVRSCLLLPAPGGSSQPPSHPRILRVLFNPGSCRSRTSAGSAVHSGCCNATGNAAMWVHVALQGQTCVPCCQWQTTPV